MCDPGPPPTAEELAEINRKLSLRVERLARMAFLAGQLNPTELEGLIQLAEVALGDRRALVGLDRKTAAEGMAYMLPPGVF